MPISFSKRLLAWYEKYGRHNLPWQHNPTSYRIWISEIMLQQTQVTTVIPYYQRFMRSFSNIKALATASEDDVLSHWSGLGYYARARNIHKTAQIIHAQHRGKFPTTVDALSELPGIGQSTAGAIISFSMQKKAVILDGNVKRVLTRYFAIEEAVNKTETMNALWMRAEKLTPEKNAHQYNQAIMDLGATLCTRTKPRCPKCPFSKDCLAFKNNQSTFYPVKTVKKTRPIKSTCMLIIKNKQDEILLLKRPSKGIWGGLWSFPEESGGRSRRKHLKLMNEFPTITHQFTHFTLNIAPILLSIDNHSLLKIDAKEFIWYKLNSPLPGGISTPVAKILKALNL